METKEYEYHGLVASSWDFLRGDVSKFPDRLFYRGLLENGGEPAEFDMFPKGGAHKPAQKPLF